MHYKDEKNLNLLHLCPLPEKSTSSNKNPSKPPVVSLPPKATEDRTANTHFGVVLGDHSPDRGGHGPSAEPGCCWTVTKSRVNRPGRCGPRAGGSECFEACFVSEHKQSERR